MIDKNAVPDNLLKKFIATVQQAAVHNVALVETMGYPVHSLEGSAN